MTIETEITPAQAVAERTRATAAELSRQARRRRELTADYIPPEGEQISDNDIRDADASVVAEWVAQGKLGHMGVAPDKQRTR